MRTAYSSITLSLALICPVVFANDTTIEACVMEQFSTGGDELTLRELREICTKPALDEITVNNIEKQHHVTTGVISNRIINERKSAFDPYVITPHNMNYILPAYATNAINTKAYQTETGYEENLEDIEAKYQISLKVPLNSKDIFTEDDGLYLGFTVQAWWQLYAQGISKPFRETNYQPELFYITPLDWHPFDGNTGLMLGIEHQSNGRGQLLSRSWNRIYVNFLYEKDNFAFSFKPWVRLAEDKKTSQFDPDGDDNPDIDDYFGHFELGTVYKWDTLEFSFMGRKNFATHHGFAELGLTFPLWGKLRGYATTSTGYGESLIDYNYSQTRFGIGIALNDVL